jgi:hypothetical protein
MSGDEAPGLIRLGPASADADRQGAVRGQRVRPTVGRDAVHERPDRPVDRVVRGQ